jgi:hypothetical protein
MAATLDQDPLVHTLGYASLRPRALVCCAHFAYCVLGLLAHRTPQRRRSKTKTTLKGAAKAG